MAILMPADGDGAQACAVPWPFPAQAAACRRWLAAGWRWLASLLMLGLALSSLANGSDAPAAPPASVERAVKAAFLYKFLGYIEFPATADSGGPLVVGVVGADDVGIELARITAGRTVGTRPVSVRPLREGEPLNGLHMLFVGAETAKPATVLKAAQQAGVLSVSETEGGLQQGSVINFRVVEERVRFEVSLPSAEKSNVKLSSRLLSVAYHVQKGSQ
ncbi:YfiR family protein [Pseudoduganella sp. LjRoot289]|uniref:YfiR family protein n=1 Tax=Pseudoduganella sp. LjRoot289 TaxID=3342314 RepID=UPI003ECC538D